MWAPPPPPRVLRWPCGPQRRLPRPPRTSYRAGHCGRRHRVGLMHADAAHPVVACHLAFFPVVRAAPSRQHRCTRCTALPSRAPTPAVDSPRRKCEPSSPTPRRHCRVASPPLCRHASFHPLEATASPFAMAIEATSLHHPPSFAIPIATTVFALP